jgi:hypothetical protein
LLALKGIGLPPAAAVAIPILVSMPIIRLNEHLFL